MGRRAGTRFLLAALAAGACACTASPPAGNRGSDGGDAGTGGAGGLAGGGGSGGIAGSGGSGGIAGSGGAGGSGGAETVCGDGVRGAGEACDDGNREARDGCDASCRYECLGDADCDTAAGQVCRPFDEYLPVYGTCVNGTFCNVDSNCHSLDPARCPNTEACVCVPSEAAAAEGLAGLCRERLEACQPCTGDAECGSSNTFSRPARCASLDGDGATQRVCLTVNHPAIPCAAGFRPDDAGEFCVPLEGRCPEPECRIDADCSGGLRCNPEARVCVPTRCHLDPATGATVGCGGAFSACHVGDLATWTLASCDWAREWGWGWCGPPCAVDADCAARLDPRNGDAFVCRAEGGTNRCRPPGCIEDADCVPPDGPYVGFCEAATGACVFDACRLEAPPRLCGAVPDDCRNDTYCYPDPSLPEGQGRCLPPRP